MKKGLLIKYNVSNSFNSLLAVEVCGRLLFENIIAMDSLMKLPDNINRRLYSELIDAVSKLHEEDEIFLTKSEVVLFYIALNVTCVFFENKSFAEAKMILPMFRNKNENGFFHIQKTFFEFADELIRFININFAAEPQFLEALELLCEWKIARIISSPVKSDIKSA